MHNKINAFNKRIFNRPAGGVIQSSDWQLLSKLPRRISLFAGIIKCLSVMPLILSKCLSACL